MGIGKLTSAALLTGALMTGAGCASKGNNPDMSHVGKWREGVNASEQQNEGAVQKLPQGVQITQDNIKYNIDTTLNAPKAEIIELKGNEFTPEKGGNFSFNLGGATSKYDGNYATFDFGYVNGRAGTRVTVDFGETRKAIFVTGTWEGTDFSSKATIGAFQTEVEGQLSDEKIVQGVAGFEVLYKFLDNLKGGVYAVGAMDQNKFFGSRTTVDASTPGVITTEQMKEWHKGRLLLSGGLAGEWEIDENNVLHGFVGYANRGGDSGVHAGVNYEHIRGSFIFGLQLEHINAGSWNVQEYKAYVDTKVTEAFRVGVEYSRLEADNSKNGSGNRDDNYFGLRFAYYFPVSGQSNTKASEGRAPTHMTQTSILSKVPVGENKNEVKRTSQNIVPPNNLPVGANIPGLNASFGSSYTVDLSSYISDADGDTVTIVITDATGNNNLTVNASIDPSNPKKIIVTATGGNGDAIIKYKLNDGKGESGEYTINIDAMFHS